MIKDVAVNLLFCIGELAVLTCSCIALCGTAWIRDVSSEGDGDKYFIRVSGMQDQNLLYNSISGGEFDSVGLWRLYAGSGRSFPIPIRGQLQVFTFASVRIWGCEFDSLYLKILFCENNNFNFNQELNLQVDQRQLKGSGKFIREAKSGLCLLL